MLRAPSDQIDIDERGAGKCPFCPGQVVWGRTIDTDELAVTHATPMCAEFPSFIKAITHAAAAVRRGQLT